MKPRSLFRLPKAAAGFFGVLLASASADSISPETFSATLAVGESVTITKTVTVSAGTPTSSKVDVFFLMDETGSMGGPISTVKSAAASILASTLGLGDVAFAVGGYRDQGDSFAYRLLTDVTTDSAAAQTGINTWSASGGGDTPEANLYALEQAATTTAWRSGSERILIWFGDAPGHDPRLGSTEASATSALTTAGIAVQAVSTGGNLDSTGQATRISTATGGAYFASVDTASLVATITSAITTAVTSYTSVGLDLTGVPAGVAVTTSPTQVGSFDRSIERSFDFEVTFTGVAEGSYDFEIYGTVDRGRVATEKDSITVGGGGGRKVPDGGSTVVLLGGALAALGLAKRKSRA
jgi:hypothetical protein